MSLRDDLIAAKALIDTPEKWTTGSFARRHDGVQSFCAVGALRQATGGTTSLGRMSGKQFHHYNDARAFMESMLPTDSLPSFNDTHSHTEVMALFDRAIEAASASISGSEMKDA